MNASKIATLLEDSCYGFLTLNFLWGLYHIILIHLRLRRLRFRNELQQAEFLDVILDHLKQGEYSEVEELCQADGRALPQLALTAVRHRKMPFEQLRQMMSELMQRDVLGELEARMSWVAAVIKNGPLWGLFGTVLGMMGAFGRIGSGEKVEAAQIADEIAVALICTAMGLATAIPFGYSLASINIKMRGFSDSLGSGLVRLLDHFKPAKPKPGAQV
jgi:biopolymer transport protein ExbB